MEGHHPDEEDGDEERLYETKPYHNTGGLPWRTLPQRRSLLQVIPLVLQDRNITGTHREDETVLFEYAGAGDLDAEAIYILHSDIPAVGRDQEVLQQVVGMLVQLKLDVIRVETGVEVHGLLSGLENQAFAVSIHNNLGFAYDHFNLRRLAGLCHGCHPEEDRQKEDDMFNRFHSVL